MIFDLIHDLIAQLRRNFKRLSLLALVAAVPIGFVVFARFGLNIPVAFLTKDPASLGGFSGLAGVFSQIGLFAWVGAVTALLFTAIHFKEEVARRKVMGFMVSSIAITCVLFLDDAFMLHESFFPAIGIPEKAAYLSYLIALLAYLGVFFKTLLRTEYILLLAALAGFAFSMAIDVLSDYGFASIFFEDSAKFTGILLWMAYYWTVCKAVILNSFRSEPLAGRPE